MATATRSPNPPIAALRLGDARDGMPFALITEDRDGGFRVRAFFGCVDDALAYAMHMSIDMDGGAHHVYSMSTRTIVLTVWPIDPGKEG